MKNKKEVLGDLAIVAFIALGFYGLYRVFLKPKRDKI